MNAITPEVVVLLGGMVVAVTTDLRVGLIPNVLTGPMILAGLVIHAVSGDPLLPVVGCVAAFALHFPLWLLNVEKGGDAKLMIAVGALVGWAEMIETSLWYAVLYLPIGLIVLLVRGKLGNLWRVIRWSAYRAAGVKLGDPPEPTTLLTAPVIAAASVAAIATDWLHLFG